MFIRVLIIQNIIVIVLTIGAEIIFLIIILIRIAKCLDLLETTVRLILALRELIIPIPISNPLFVQMDSFQ